MKSLKKQGGIGLLELMLAMAIIAILLVLSIQYFQSSKNSTLINQGVQEIEDIMGIVQGITDPSSVVVSDNYLNDAIVLSGSLPDQYIVPSKDDNDVVRSILSPWSEPGSSGGGAAYLNNSLLVSYTETNRTANIKGILPNYACTNLTSQFMQSKNNVDNSIVSVHSTCAGVQGSNGTVTSKNMFSLTFLVQGSGNMKYHE